MKDESRPCKDSWRATNKDGYHAMNYKKYGYATEHRYIYATYHDITLELGDVIRHLCNNPWCVEITHLELGDQNENVQDSVKAGTHKNPSFKGESNPMAQLTVQHIKKIRRLYSTGRYSHSDLAEEFDVDRITILNIVNGHTWKEV